MGVLSLRGNWQAMRELLSLVHQHRELTWEMTRREFTEKHAGQWLGGLWAVIHPLVLVSIYVFIFTVVFGIRFGDSLNLPRDFVTYILAGLIPWLVCSDAMSKACGVLVGNANLVKQVVFPIEVLPIKTAIASSVTQIVMVALLIGYMLVRFGGLPWTIVLLPALLGLQLMAMVGIGLTLAAAGGYVRDLKEFVQIFSTAGLYLTPIIYLPEMVPAIFRPLLYLNPFSYMVWCYQDAVYFGAIVHPESWFAFAGFSLLIFAVGYRLFRRLKGFVGNFL